MVASSKVKSALSGSSRFVVVSLGFLVLTLLPVQAQQESESQSLGDSTTTEQEVLEDLLNATQNEKKRKTIPNTFTANQPTISNAKVVAISGADSSLRAYFFKNNQAAEAFAQAITTFKIATRFKLVVSATEIAMYDADNKKIVMPPNNAEQLEIDSGKVVLLAGTRKQQARVEKLMRALGAD